MCTIFAGLFANENLITADPKEQPARSPEEVASMLAKLDNLQDPVLSPKAIDDLSEHGANLLLRWLKDNAPEDVFRLYVGLNLLDYYSRQTIEFSGKVPADLNDCVGEYMIDFLNRLAALGWF